MPRPKPWLSRIVPIVNQLEELPETTQLDRDDVQKLFGIGRSAAKELMAVVGIRITRAQDGGALVSQEALLRYLRTSPDAEAALQEAVRRQRLARQLDQAAKDQKLRAIKLPCSSADEWCTLAELPNVTIEDGILRVAFSSPTELMADLYRLVKAAGNDWDAFERACASTEEPKRKAG